MERVEFKKESGKMVQFTSKDLIFIDAEYRKSLRYKKESEYRIYEFKDKQTKRLFRVYDFGKKEKGKEVIFTNWEIEIGKQYLVQGWLNSAGKNLFLIADEIKEVEENNYELTTSNIDTLHG